MTNAGDMIALKQKYLQATQSVWSEDIRLENESVYLPVYDSHSKMAYYITPQGKEMWGTTFEETQIFSEGLAAVKSNGLYGYINQSGEYVIEPQFLTASIFSSGVAVVSTENRCFGINHAGEAVVSGEWDELSDFYNGVAIFKRDGLYGLIDIQGNIILGPEYQKISSYTDFFVLKKSDQIGIFNLQMTSPIWYDSIYPFDNEYARIEKDGKYGLIELTTISEVIQPYYTSLMYMGEGVYRVRINHNVMGMVDKWGTWLYKSPKDIGIMPLDYFLYGKIAANVDGKWGILINPLLYGDWAETEVERAQFVGLPKVQGRCITISELSELAETTGKFRQGLCERGVLPSKKNIFVSKEDLLKISQMDPGKIATRADVAYLIYLLAKEQNEITEHYSSEYNDIKELPRDIQNAIAYTTALSVISCQDNEHFEPEKKITDVEATEMLVRFVENTLDSLAGENEGNAKLKMESIF